MTPSSESLFRLSDTRLGSKTTVPKAACNPENTGKNRPAAGKEARAEMDASFNFFKLSLR